MDFEQLQYIIDLYEKKSLAAVAEDYFTSHQSVRNSIKYLEEELGVPLIISTKQGTNLTEAGQCLYKYSLQFDTLYSKLKNEIDEFKDKDNTIREPFNLYIAPTFSTEMYLKFFEEFEKRREISINLHIYPAEKIVDSVYGMQNSIGFFPMNNSKDSFDTLRKIIKKRNMKIKVIKEQQCYAVSYKDSKYAKYDNFRMKDLKQMQLYTFLNTNIFCGSKQVDTDIQYFNDYNLLKSLLKKNNGFAIIKKKEYEYYFGAKNAKYPLILIDDVYIKNVAIYNKNDENNKEILSLINEMKGLFD